MTREAVCKYCGREIYSRKFIPIGLSDGDVIRWLDHGDRLPIYCHKNSSSKQTHEPKETENAIDGTGNNL